MESISFVIKNLPPQPRNSSHTLRKVNRGGKDIHFMGKTELALMFEKDLTHRLKRLLKKEFAGFDYFEYSLVVGTPAKEFWTVKNEVSKTSIDFDAHKVFADVIARECGFNDGQIVCHYFLKVPVNSQFWYFAVKIAGCKASTIVRTYEQTEFLNLLEEKGYQSI